MNTKYVYVVFNNTDRVEGRGSEYPFAVCELESTALRVAKGHYVQGRDCPIKKVKLMISISDWYISFDDVPKVSPTNEDIKNEQKLIVRRAFEKFKTDTIAKAKAMGLTDEEIEVLTSV